jgi:3-dehydroquinate synthase
MDSTFQWDARTKVEFLKKLPSEARLAESLGFKPEKYLVIHDRQLRRNESVAKWIKDFSLVYPVNAGESLKEMSAFAGHLRKIFKLISPFSHRSICILALGGGTIGDFAGFTASVLKRGVPLIHIPTTLLSAMDSAHGGKTALNIGGIKNQIGTFYPADSVYLVKSLFEGLPETQLQSASGELAKMALIEGGELYDRFKNKFRIEMESTWDLLPIVIEAKYKVVLKDPFERSGERQILNLGHTLGHALEAHHSLPHGVAVGEGLIFAVRWSEHQGYFRGDAGELTTLLSARTGVLGARDFARAHGLMSRSRLHKFISGDKKLTDTRHLNFIFLEDVGRPFRKNVTLESFLTETQRQGWTSV